MCVINWKELEKKDFEEYRLAYIAWMYKEENLGNCEECPHNCRTGDGRKNWRSHSGYVIGPCEQQHCWVTAHVHPERLR